MPQLAGAAVGTSSDRGSSQWGPDVGGFVMYASCDSPGLTWSRPWSGCKATGPPVLILDSPASPIAWPDCIEAICPIGKSLNCLGSFELVQAFHVAIPAIMAAIPNPKVSALDVDADA